MSTVIATRTSSASDELVISDMNVEETEIIKELSRKKKKLYTISLKIKKVNLA